MACAASRKPVRLTPVASSRKSGKEGSEEKEVKGAWRGTGIGSRTFVVKSPVHGTRKVFYNLFEHGEVVVGGTVCEFAESDNSITNIRTT